jgi:hypothetical protein
MLMFIMAVFFDLQFPENEEYCAGFTVDDECQAENSMFDVSLSTCKWKVEGGGGLCVPGEADLTVRVRNNQIIFII